MSGVFVLTATGLLSSFEMRSASAIQASASSPPCRILRNAALEEAALSKSLEGEQLCASWMGQLCRQSLFDAVVESGLLNRADQVCDLLGCPSDVPDRLSPFA